MGSGSPPGADITGSTHRFGRSARIGLRLALKPNAAWMGAVDGAWWPRSTDPLAEFPAMIAGVALRRGRVDRVAFNSIAWDDAPGRVVVDGVTILLEGFRSLDRRTVSVSGANWHRMVLLVIPPDAEENAAAIAITRAASGANTEQPTQILTTSGVDNPGGATDRRPARRTGGNSVMTDESTVASADMNQHFARVLAAITVASSGSTTRKARHRAAVPGVRGRGPRSG